MIQRPLKVIRLTTIYLCTDDTLKVDNMREVLDVFWDYRASWKLIGVELGIDSGTLDAINKNHRRVEDQLTELIVKWLRRNNPRPMRSAMAKVLQSKYLMEGASSIQGIYKHLV